MLPNHSPLVIAEQFGTLESLFPGRIDLGLAARRVPIKLTARALRRNLASDPDQFPQDVLELIGYFAPPAPESTRHGRPRRRLARCPSGSSARACSARRSRRRWVCPLRLPRTFAPAMMMQAMEIYRARFQPSEQLDRPYVDAGIQCLRRRVRRASALSRDIDAASLREPAQRPAHAAAAALEGYDASCRRAARAIARRRAHLLRRRLAARRFAMRWRPSSNERRPTN